MPNYAGARFKLCLQGARESAKAMKLFLLFVFQAKCNGLVIFSIAQMN